MGWGGYLWWRIHEVKLENIVDTERLEQQNHVGQIGALNFWHGGDQQFVFVLAVSVQAVRLAVGSHIGLHFI